MLFFVSGNVSFVYLFQSEFLLGFEIPYKVDVPIGSLAQVSYYLEVCQGKFYSWLALLL